MLTEAFLHYLWRFRLLQAPLFCVTGEPVMVIQPGEYNRDGGPDFINARVRIGRTLWAGNVEIHLRASDWFRHGHQGDPAYHNVILHVVDHCDREVTGGGNQTIPCLEVHENYPPGLIDIYQTLLLGKQWIPCQKMVGETDLSVFRLWAPVLVFERLNARANTLRKWMDYAEKQWDELAYQVMATAMGSQINAQPFELLARSTPFRILQRHRDQVPILESLLFGQAGLLNPLYQERYPSDLLRSYRFYQENYSLTPLEQGIWKFLRLRPVNFPTIRISQFADMIHRISSFHENLESDLSLRNWMEILRATASVYWNSHFTFERESPGKIKRTGQNTIYLLLINGIIPLLFFKGTEKDQAKFMEKAFSLLEEIPGEKNRLTFQWSELGMPSDNALMSQALIHLKQAYCDQKRCLECRIGMRLLKNQSPITDKHAIKPHDQKKQP